MGIIKRGILGGFSKKVANVVGSSWKGIAYMRSLPLSVANPRTPAQVGERNKFKGIAVFASLYLGNVIQPLWNRLAEQMSGYNLFVQKNIVAVSNLGVVDYDNVLMTTGNIEPVAGLVATAVTANDEIDVTFSDNTGSGNSQSTDILCCAVYNRDTGVATVVRNSGITRADGTGTFQFIEMSQGDLLPCWFWFERDNICSDSVPEPLIAP